MTVIDNGGVIFIAMIMGAILVVIVISFDFVQRHFKRKLCVIGDHGVGALVQCLQWSVDGTYLVSCSTAGPAKVGENVGVVITDDGDLEWKCNT